MKKLVIFFTSTFLTTGFQTNVSLAESPPILCNDYGYQIEDDKVIYCDEETEEVILEEVDVDSFKILEEFGSYLAKDKNTVFCSGNDLNADPNSFSALENRTDYYKDNSSVYYKCSKIENSDPETFQKIGESDFNIDKNNIYYKEKKIEDVDKTTFEVLTSSYAKDKNKVYYAYRTVDSADPETFETEKVEDEFNQYCPAGTADARDKTSYYSNGTMAYNLFKGIYTPCLRETEGLIFKDVNENTYYINAIQWMAKNEVISGYPDGNFEPDQCVNRVELLKMIFKTLNIDTSSYKAELFKDTMEGQWYTPYVIAGKARGTIEGYPDGMFKPEQCVNRVEAIKMAVLEFNEGATPLPSGQFYLPYDIEQIRASGVANPWWMSYFVSALSANTLGTEHFPRFNTDPSKFNTAYNFGPAEPMSRKEVAEMLFRMKVVKDYDLMTYQITYEKQPKALQ